MKISTLLGAALMAAGVQSANCTPTYKNPNATVDARVADLLSRMTNQEKAAKLIQGTSTSFTNLTTGAINETGLEWTLTERSHSVWVGLNTTPLIQKRAAELAQGWLKNNTELGIPTFVQSEGFRGFLAQNATIFNSPIGIGCSFNTELVSKMANIIGKEAAALGVNQIFAPVLDLGRELRFGRVEETFGEDPFLAGEFGYVFVKGLQDQGINAQVKHFAAFASPEQGINLASVHGGERELRSVYLPPFKRALIDAGALSTMSSFNSYDGIPTTSNHHMLTEILREEWGFEYHVQCDSGGIKRLAEDFKLCPMHDHLCVVKEGLLAGNDVEMGGGWDSFQYIPDFIEDGTFDQADLDKAVGRVLRSMFVQGLFEKPYSGVPDDEIYNYLGTDEHKEIALQLDTESIVLLENKDNILPLSKDTNIAIIGPMAHGFSNFGSYTIGGTENAGVTFLDGIEAVTEGTIRYAQGCERWGHAWDESGFPEAIAAAEASDVAIVFVGTWSRDQDTLWAGPNATTGEHVDSHHLNLIGAMPALVRAIIDTETPTIVVYSSGKPITEPWISDEAAGLIQHFYNSEMGGHAFAKILYGDANPSGKLSVSFPHDVGNLPIYYDYLRSGRWNKHRGGKEHANGTMEFGYSYVLGQSTALYDFGYGLSYTTFNISDISASATTVTPDDVVTVSVKVTNTGERDGAEVVQIYIEDVVSSVDVSRYNLRGFKKVFVEAGQSKTVEIDLEVERWGLWNRKMEYVVEPGNFTVMVGTSSEIFHGNVTVLVT